MVRKPSRESIFHRPSPAHRIKCLGQVDEGNKETHVLLSAFLLDLSEYKDHVGGCSVRSETALAFRGEVLNDGGYESVQEDAGKHFACYGQKCNAAIIGAVRFLTLVFV